MLVELLFLLSLRAGLFFSGHLHAPDILLSGQPCSILTEEQTGWATGAVFHNLEKTTSHLTEFEKHLLCFPAHVLDTTMAALFWQQVIITIIPITIMYSLSPLSPWPHPALQALPFFGINNRILNLILWIYQNKLPCNYAHSIVTSFRGPWRAFTVSWMDASCLDRVACNGYVIASLSVLLSLTQGDMALKRVACYQEQAEGEHWTLEFHLALLVKSVCPVQTALEIVLILSGTNTIV